MNIPEYISSGIVESYVLGLASPEERAEFERICSAHKEVLMAREAFEKQLENGLQQQRVSPPRELKSSILSRIGMEEVEKPLAKLPEKPVLIPRAGFPRMVAAASLILLL